MKQFLLLISFCFTSFVFGQEITPVINNAVLYHLALVKKDYKKIDLFTHRKLKYSHSNGWTETKKEQASNLKTGYLNYFSILEDSVEVTIDNKSAVLTFKATIDVAVKGNRNTYQLFVKETWKKMGNHYFIICREASKIK